MRLLGLTFLSLFSVAAFAQQQVQDCTKLILTLKPPADDAMYARARADIQAAGGTIKYEYHEALKGMAICVPKDELETLKNKDYVDAIESDGEVHIS
ncbi:hypothetical protein VTP01DRAFT_9763 [Rhizomucor pusillus]|uniref:uncharacterized protein n=1 Tax=Rhizomucor pusillus TaxID=4840 RepID=UPI003743D23B